MTDLLNPKTIEKAVQNVKPTEIQIESIRCWLEHIKKLTIQGEIEEYTDFSNRILQEVFGLSLKTDKKSHKKLYIHEQKKNQDFIISSDLRGKNPESHLAVIEAKKLGTNLFIPVRYSDEKRSPMDQLWGYMCKNKIKYGICTDYSTFILVSLSEHYYDNYYKFDLKEIDKNKMDKSKEIEINNQKMREFVGIFAEKLFVSDFDKNMKTLIKNTKKEEIDITDDFYYIYSETRNMLIQNIEKRHQVNNKQTSSKIAQSILDKLLFIFFAEDKHLVHDKKPFQYMIERLFDSNSNNEPFSDITRSFFDRMIEMFKLYDSGSQSTVPDGFNGGLFMNIHEDNQYPFYDFDNDIIPLDQARRRKIKTMFHERKTKLADAVRKTDYLNPIIENILIMESYDFNTEITVNILGHIFEQSISDLETIQKGYDMQRKDEGAYYTPAPLTEYVCRKTIIPYLSLDGKTENIEDLVMDYVKQPSSNNTIVTEISIQVVQQRLNKLKNKMKTLRILDPACGSGAFLIRAVDLLMEIYDMIDSVEYAAEYKRSRPIPIKTNRKRIEQIIKNNIYGVDSNSQAVEIAKLSLFFKIARKDSRLPTLDRNIVVGNSLITPQTSVDIGDKKYHNEKTGRDIDDNALDWNLIFHQIMNGSDNQGFDIIIGNPPWEIIKPTTREFYSPIYNADPLHTGKFRSLASSKKIQYINNINNTNKEIKQRYGEYKMKKNQLSKYLGKSPEYTAKSSSDYNTYQFFVERSHQLLKPNGMFGMILPSGIYADAGTEKIRKLILRRSTINHLIGFNNKNYDTQQNIFPDADDRLKFCILVFKKHDINGLKKADKIEENLKILADLEDHNKKLIIYIKNAKKKLVDGSKFINPKSTETLSKKEKQLNINNNKIKQLREEYDWKNKSILCHFKLTDVDLLKNINFEEYRLDLNISLGFKVFPILEIDNEETKGIFIKMLNHTKLKNRCWNVILTHELHMKKDRGYLNSSRLGFPIYEGKTMNQFTHLHAVGKYHISKNDTKKRFTSDSDKDTAHTKFRLVIRKLASSSNERTVIATIIPPDTFITDSLNYFLPQKLGINNMLYLCGMLNSYPVDFFIRHITNTNLNHIQIYEIPIPIYDHSNPDHIKIIKNTASLICCGNDEYENMFLELTKKLQVELEDVYNFYPTPLKNSKDDTKIKNDKIKHKNNNLVQPRIHLEAEINICAFRIYNFSNNEINKIFQNFTIAQSSRSITNDLLKEKIYELSKGMITKIV